MNPVETSMTPEIKQALRKFLAENSDDGAANITDETNLFESGILDSFKILTTVLFIEETYAISLDFEELNESNFHSIDAMADFIRTRL